MLPPSYLGPHALASTNLATPNRQPILSIDALSLLTFTNGKHIQDKDTSTVTTAEIRRGSTSSSISGSDSPGRTRSQPRGDHRNPVCNLPTQLSALLSALRPERANRFSASAFPTPTSHSDTATKRPTKRGTSSSTLTPPPNSASGMKPFRNIYDFSQGPRPLRRGGGRERSTSASPAYYPASRSDVDTSASTEKLLLPCTQTPTRTTTSPTPAAASTSFRPTYDLSQAPRPLQLKLRSPR